MQLGNMLRFKMAWARPTGPENGIVLSSRVRLARNLEGRAFPSRASGEQLSGVLRDVTEAARRSPGLRSAARVELGPLDAVDREFLLERHLISRLLAEAPAGRAVLVGEGEVLSAMVNEEDHLRLQAIDSGLRLEELHARLAGLEEELSGALAFAFHEEWGYLAACPTNAGTGLRASALVHLPALAITGQISPLLEALPRRGLIARGLYGEGSQVMGDFYQIANATAMGRTEEELIDAVGGAVREIAGAESRAREELAAGEQKLRLEDLVYRALGSLERARLMTYPETMRHLSCVRMGLSLGWKLDADLTTINELIVLCQPAHIQMLAGRQLEPSDRDFLRATLLRRRLRGDEAGAS